MFIINWFTVLFTPLWKYLFQNFVIEYGEKGSFRQGGGKSREKDKSLDKKNKQWRTRKEQLHIENAIFLYSYFPYFSAKY